MRFFLGLIGIIIGSLITIKSEWILQNVGRNQWAEEHLGYEGGSRLLYKLIGITIIVLAMLYMTGLVEPILIKILSPLFPPLS